MWIWIASSFVFGALLMWMIIKRFSGTNITESLKSNKKGFKMVICVRTDLPMSKGKVAAQCCHGALAAYKESMKRKPEVLPSYSSKVLKAWERDGQAKVTLKVSNEAELKLIEKNARKGGLIACSIQDAGRTQIDPGTTTVLAIGPDYIEEIDQYTRQLSLY